MVAEHPDRLSDALDRLARNLSFAHDAAARLEAGAEELNRKLTGAITANVAAFSETRNPDILPELAAHVARHTAELVRLLRAGRSEERAFVSDYARRCAEQHFPLEATVHAYRISQTQYLEFLCERDKEQGSRDPQIGTAVHDLLEEYTKDASTSAVSAYVAQIRLLADVEGDRRAELMNILLDGYDESDRRVSRILRDAGYLDTRRSFCVAVAQSVDPVEMHNAPRARRLADSIDGIMQRSPVRRLIDLRDNMVTIVFSHARRTSGWTAPRSSLASSLAPDLSLAGPAVLIGVSNDMPSTAHIPNALQQARLALQFADVSRRVVQYAEIPVRRMLLHLATRDMQRTLPAWSNELFACDARANGELTRTLRAYADASMNVLKAATLLGLHPNTVYSRLQRIVDATGLDPRSFHALTELLLVADLKR